jgi:hypothetical protein
MQKILKQISTTEFRIVFCVVQFCVGAHVLLMKELMNNWLGATEVLLPATLTVLAAMISGGKAQKAACVLSTATFLIFAWAKWDAARWNLFFPWIGLGPILDVEFWITFTLSLVALALGIYQPKKRLDRAIDEPKRV